jgi:3-deoxy-manno-octulosonate cytidylyltransferase (CMP-KDO synthetase)
MPKVHTFIPARFNSSRYPGKPLVDINGSTLLVHTAKAAHRAATEYFAGPNQVLEYAGVTVLTDHEGIYDEALANGFNAEMTPSFIQNGTARCALVADRMHMPPDDIIINWQGDAPLTPSSALRGILDVFSRATVSHSVVTAGYRDHMYADASMVSIAVRPFGYVPDESVMDAMYFSRQELGSASGVMRHMGIYGYRVHALRAYAGYMSARAHEEHEDLEQLRWLEHGVPIAVARVDRPEGRLSELNTPKDLIALRRIL